MDHVPDQIQLENYKVPWIEPVNSWLVVIDVDYSVKSIIKKISYHYNLKDKFNKGFKLYLMLIEKVSSYLA